MDRKYLWFLLVISLIGASMAGIVTSKYGPGVSADATKYLSTAENIASGRGFFDHTGRPLLWWPPLYPLVLAGLVKLTGMDVVWLGGSLNVLLFAVNIFLHGLIVYLAFKDRPVFQYLGGLFILTSDMAMRIHANIASEPLFVTFSLVFLLASVDYVQTKSRRSFWWMVVMSVLACLQRYLGASLIAAGGCFILYAHRGRILTAVREGILFGLLSILPIAAWMIGHNLMQYNSFWGVTGSIVLPMENLRLSISKMLHWFIPYHPLLQPLFDQPWIVVAVIVILLLLINKKENWATFGKALCQPYPFVSLLFIVLTILGLMYTVTTADHTDLFSDRYYVGLLSIVLVILFLVLDTLVLPHIRFGGIVVSKALVAVFFMWLVAYPGWSMMKYISLSREVGEASGYNVYNNRLFHNNPVIKQMQKIARQDPSAALYSNYSDGVWFFTRHDAPLMPRSTTMNINEISEAYAGWPGDKPGYIIWIIPNSIYNNVIPPGMLAKIADLELVYEDKRGVIYRVSAR